MKKDYYKILGIKEGSNISTIKKAYRELSKKYHPDVNKTKTAKKKFEEIKEAYDNLINEKSKKNSMEIVKSTKASPKNDKAANKDLIKKIIAVIVVVLVFGCLYLISAKNGVKYAETETFTEEEQAELNNITVDDYLRIKAGSEAAVIYIARPTCSHCASQTPRMKYIKYKYKTEINYLNTDEFDEEGNDYNKLVSSDPYFENDFGTPTILIVQNDKILGDIAGEREVSGVVSFFKEYGIIKK